MVVEVMMEVAAVAAEPEYSLHDHVFDFCPE